MPAPLTRSYGAFLGSLATRPIPPACLAVARLGFTDSLGVLLAGRDEPAGHHARGRAAGRWR
jgi:hypothetical protein